MNSALLGRTAAVVMMAVAGLGLTSSPVVNAATTGTVTAATGTVTVVIGPGANVALSTPGYARRFTTTTTVTLPVGDYTATNDTTTTAAGIYRPVTATTTVKVTGAPVVYRPRYTFTRAATGLVRVIMTTPGRVTLTGVMQRRTFTTSATARMVAGTYLMSATTVVTATGTYRPTPTRAQTRITVTPGATATIRPTYVTSPPPCPRPAPTTADGYAALLNSLERTGAFDSGDGHIGVQLHDGRTLLVFGDALAGPVINGVVHPAGLRHSLVVELNKGCARTLPGHSRVNRSWLPDDSPTSYYWPTAITRVDIGGQFYLYVFASRIIPVTGGFGFDSTGTALFLFRDVDGADPVYLRTVATPSAHVPATAINWGIASLTDGADTWVWGAKFRAGAWGKEIWVRKVPTATIANLSTWGPATKIFDFGQCAPAAYNAHTTATGIRLVGKACDGFGQTANAWDAPTPAGPYTQSDLFDAPSNFAAGPYTYCPAAYPWIRLSGGKVLAALSHNNIRFTLWDMLTRWREQRPSFHAIDWPAQ